MFRSQANRLKTALATVGFFLAAMDCSSRASPTPSPSNQPAPTAPPAAPAPTAPATIPPLTSEARTEDERNTIGVFRAARAVAASGKTAGGRSLSDAAVERLAEVLPRYVFRLRPPAAGFGAKVRLVGVTVTEPGPFTTQLFPA
jgi:hypothetical protein